MRRGGCCGLDWTARPGRLATSYREREAGSQTSSAGPAAPPARTGDVEPRPAGRDPPRPRQSLHAVSPRPPPHSTAAPPPQVPVARLLPGQLAYPAPLPRRPGQACRPDKTMAGAFLPILFPGDLLSAGGLAVPHHQPGLPAPAVRPALPLQPAGGGPGQPGQPHPGGGAPNPGRQVTISPVFSVRRSLRYFNIFLNTGKSKDIFLFLCIAKF